VLLTLLLVALAGCSDDDSDRIATDGGDFDLSTDFGPLDGSLDLGADLSTCPDVDGDGVPAAACGGTDCDDGDPTRYPGAEEVCDGDDEDCNSATLGPDADGDGETYLGCCNGSEGCGTDCDDTRRSVSAAASETCNGEDDDCDGRVDEDVLTTACFDADGDGRGAVSPTVVGCAVPVGAVTTCNDCDDGDPSRYLGAPESCNDVDDDCDGAVDESCACSEGATRPCGSTGGACVVGTQVCLGGAWESECVGAVTPEAEACDGLDNDCDGLTDEGLQTIFYADCDLDGSGASASAVATCVRPASAPDGCARGAWTILGGDCDDSDPLRSARVGCGGAMDAGAPDLGMDAGTTDLGVDAGMEDLGVDAGTTDAGTDGGVVDAGVDAGPRDLGVDASAMDLGIDSGATDLGVDAGTAMDASTMPVFGAAVATQSIPRLLTAGRPATFTITMTNTGTTGWMGSTFQLASGNVPTTLWGLTESALGSAEFVAAGATRTFTLSVTAPTTPGTYSSDWIMEQVPGIGRFGEVARTTDIVVTLCGNGVLDDAEICDDANLLDGDGCSSICVPSVSYDLLTDADRTLVGSRSLRALAAVTIGDFTNDGVPEIVVGESADFMPAGGTNRSQAGTVYAYAGGAGFFGGTSTVPAGATLVVGGASASDGLGATSTSGLVVADVTGDGVRDLLLSAQGGDGIGEARLNAGEVYVLRGGAGLASAGTIDLGASPASPLLVARSEHV
jgi:cysteine-rich repeat protein